MSTIAQEQRTIRTTPVVYDIRLDVSGMFEMLAYNQTTFINSQLLITN